MQLKIVGFDMIEEQDRKDFEKIFNDYMEKSQKRMKNISSFNIDLKEYKKESNRKKFSIHLRIAIDTKNKFEAEAADFDLKRTLHKLFKKIDEQLEHRFHTSDQHKK